MLPAGWTARRPTLDDVPAILAVVHAADNPTSLATLYHSVGLREQRWTDMYERSVAAAGV
jgi:hypothetical protein